MENRLRIGQEITIEGDFQISSAITNKAINIKAGDKGFVDSKGLIHYTSGEARGKIHSINKDDCVQGYDNKNIAQMIYKRLSYFNIKEILSDYDIDSQDFIDEIEDILLEIL